MYQYSNLNKKYINLLYKILNIDSFKLHIYFLDAIIFATIMNSLDHSYGFNLNKGKE